MPAAGAALMPSFIAERLSVGTFYNPHLAEALLSEGESVDHLSMADPPAVDDAFFLAFARSLPCCCTIIWDSSPIP